ncbi:glycoside hydrolase family 99-like domain-containing protein [Vibrio cyclitrophicus]
MKTIYKKLFKTKSRENTKLKSVLIDPAYYFSTYPEVKESGLEAAEHFDAVGWKLGHNPSKEFNTNKYLEAHRDVKASGVNPLNHYVTFGYLEGRETFPVVELSGKSSEKLSLSEGKVQEKPALCEASIAAKCLFELLFDENYYLANNDDVREAGIDAYEHFSNYGWKEYRNPSAHFNVYKYLEENIDIKEAGINPLLHYVNYGRNEGRTISSNGQADKKFLTAYQELSVVHSGHSTAPEYAPCIKAPLKKDKDAPQVIAFYLPQFHPFKENNAWWGKGFTEWTNVAKAVPQFEGHYQPRLPSDLGYYDLRLIEVMEEQTKMAAAHGVDGFCFHYYWFAGHRLMERPIEQYLAAKESIDFPFCLCWANENWSRRWDGSENDILIAQEHSEEDNEAVFYDLLRHFKDERYITVDGKPVLVIYRPDIIPDINGLTNQLRALAEKEGLPGIHLVATNAFGFDQHVELGFDAIVEFPPHNVKAECINYKLNVYNNHFDGAVFNYDDVVEYSLDRIQTMDNKKLASSYYPTVMTGWDNSARKPGKGHVFFGATPRKFQNWLEGCYRWSQNAHPKGAKFVFVNAWNEWAEGTYLEPDKKYGYAYLNAVRSTINEVLTDAQALEKLVRSVNSKKQSDTVVVAHIFYEDLVDEICDEINAARKHKKMDVALSIPNSFSLAKSKELIKRLNPVKIVVSENRGRDVWPFLQTLIALKGMNYKYGCKIHSKKSTHIAKGEEWRRSIYSGLLSKRAILAFENIIEKSDKLAIVAPSSFMCELEGDRLTDNVEALQRLKAIYKMKDSQGYQPFVAGTMFWFSFEWATLLESDKVDRELFGPELGAIDGTMAHAFERIFTAIAVEFQFNNETYTRDH